MRANTVLLALVAITNRSLAQEYEYQDYADGYEEDNLYQDYAMKHQETGGGGGGWVWRIVRMWYYCFESFYVLLIIFLPRDATIWIQDLVLVK